MSFISGPDNSAEPAAIQPRAWNITPGAVAGSSPPPSGFVTLVSFDTSGSNQIPITNGSPLTKTTSAIAGFANLFGNELVPAVPLTDTWYYDATNAYPGIQWVRWTMGSAGTIASGDCGGMLSVTQALPTCQGYFFSSAGSILNNISLVMYTGGYLVLVEGLEPYLPDTAYFAWYNPVTGLIELYRGIDNTGVLLITTNICPPLVPLGVPGFELFNGSIAEWSAGIFSP